MDKLTIEEIEDHFFSDGFTLISEIDAILSAGFVTGELTSTLDVYNDVLKIQDDEEDCYQKRMMLSLSQSMFKNRQFCVHFSVIGDFDDTGYTQVQFCRHSD